MNKFMFQAGVIVCACALFLQQPVLAAVPADGAANTDSTSDAAAQTPADQASGDPAAAQPANATPVEGTLSRWLDVNALSFSMRYRNQFDEDSYHIFNFGQERTLADGRFKFDREGKYAIAFHASSGRYFNWAYADVAGGSEADQNSGLIRHFTRAQLLTLAAYRNIDPFVAQVANHLASRGWEFYLRQLYFSASPVKQLTFEYGSLGIDHGVNSEITSFDDDGYISGGRVRVKDPNHLYLDEVSATFAYFGDIVTPNFFARGDTLTENNYRQFMGQKHFGRRLRASVDYTWLNGTHTMREGLSARVPEVRFIDSARLELYQRTNDLYFRTYDFHSGSGVSFTGSKTFKKTVQIEGGYANIDRYYTAYLGSPVASAFGFALNGDAYSLGNRAFTRVNIKASPYLNLFGFYTHTFDQSFYTNNKQGMNFGVTIDFKQLLSDKAHLF